jgi:two-component system, NarL family, invasion response regulator UvrY
MIRVFLADDHAVVRQGLKQIISENLDLSVVGEATSGDEVLSGVSRNKPDVVLLDITMPGRTGLDVLQQLKIMHPKLPVLILSMYPEDQYAMRVLRAGASGYLTKDSAPEELITAIRKVSAGGKFVSASLAEKLVLHLDADPEKPLHEVLSDREFQVLCMIASGKTVSDIADELALSVKTISTYRSRILDKMNMRSNAEITHYAIKNSLIY